MFSDETRADQQATPALSLSLTIHRSPVHILPINNDNVVTPKLTEMNKENRNSNLLQFEYLA